MARQRPSIGVFDSGIGGLSVLREIWRELPKENIVYLADQAHVPYGPRSLDEVWSFSKQITRFLLSQGAEIIVVACNTASAAALEKLRVTFPRVPFVGMEPAVKPAVEKTKSGLVGVLATPATFQGALYESVVERFANGVRLLPHTCPGLVERIEAGELNSQKTQRILDEALGPLLAGGIDTVVLGCTHYPFVIPVIESITGPGVRVIDPAPAVARQVRRVWKTHVSDPSQRTLRMRFPSRNTRFFTSGDPKDMETLLPHLLSVQASVDRVKWKNGSLLTA